jgi:hypothetical protein
MTAMTTMRTTAMLRSKRCRRRRGQQELTFIPAAMTMQQATTTYMLMDGKSATTDTIRSNPPIQHRYGKVTCG